MNDNLLRDLSLFCCYLLRLRTCLSPTKVSHSKPAPRGLNFTTYTDIRSLGRPPVSLNCRKQRTADLRTVLLTTLDDSLDMVKATAAKTTTTTTKFQLLDEERSLDGGRRRADGETSLARMRTTAAAAAVAAQTWLWKFAIACFGVVQCPTHSSYFINRRRWRTCRGAIVAPGSPNERPACTDTGPAAAQSLS